MGKCQSKSPVLEPTSATDAEQAQLHMLRSKPSRASQLMEMTSADVDSQSSKTFSDDDNDNESISSNEYESDEDETRLRVRLYSAASNNGAEWMLEMPKTPVESHRKKLAIPRQPWQTPPPQMADLGSSFPFDAIDPSDDELSEHGQQEDEQNIDITMTMPTTQDTKESQSPLTRSKGIRFISFNNFRLNFKENKPRHELTRCPDNSDILVDVAEDPEFSRENSLMVFVSHCHLASFNGKGKNGTVVSEAHKKNWRSTGPHPDNRENEKFQLLVEAIDLMWKTMAPGMNDCYIWMDYCCLDQNKKPRKEIETQKLSEIMKLCDCILTPIVDHNHEDWEYSSSVIPDWIKDYKSTKFSGENKYESYWQRAWCRLETLYGAHLPLYEKEKSEEIQKERAGKFCGGLEVASKHNLRAHFLYGTK